jgi:hypothetical protein
MPSGIVWRKEAIRDMVLSAIPGDLAAGAAQFGAACPSYPSPRSYRVALALATTTDDLASHSGGWVGYYRHAGRIITTEFKMFLVLYFRNGWCQGEGCDKDGEFKLMGAYDLGVRSVMLTKQYAKKELTTMCYDGHWTGAQLWGQSRCQTRPQYYRGAFHLWPASNQFRGTDAELRAELKELPWHVPCPLCTYDLYRLLAPQFRCPECGYAVDPVALVLYGGPDNLSFRESLRWRWNQVRRLVRGSHDGNSGG